MRDYTAQSLVGSLVMIIPFFLSHQLRKTRHRLILGLAINDFVQAVIVGPIPILSMSDCDLIFPLSAE
jgi:hypothetical protein